MSNNKNGQLSNPFENIGEDVPVIPENLTPEDGGDDIQPIDNNEDDIENDGKNPTLQNMISDITGDIDDDGFSVGSDMWTFLGSTMGVGGISLVLAWGFYSGGSASTASHFAGFGGALAGAAIGAAVGLILAQAFGLDEDSAIILAILGGIGGLYVGAVMAYGYAAGTGLCSTGYGCVVGIIILHVAYAIHW